jgi:hypothetical protein
LFKTKTSSLYTLPSNSCCTPGKSISVLCLQIANRVLLKPLPQHLFFLHLQSFIPVYLLELILVFPNKLSSSETSAPFERSVDFSIFCNLLKTKRRIVFSCNSPASNGLVLSFAEAPINAIFLTRFLMVKYYCHFF